MRILSRHFLNGYLIRFAFIFFSSAIALAAIEALLYRESALEPRIGAMGLAPYLLLRIPSYYFPYLIPIASFAAAFFSIALPARSHEITAIEGGGISPLRVAVPLLLAAAALSCLTLLLNETLLLRAARESARAGEPGGEVAFRDSSFWYQREGAIYRVEAFDRDARALYGVSAFERDSRGRLLRIVHAERVEMQSDGRWHFVGPTARSFDPEKPAQPARIEPLGAWSRDVATAVDPMLRAASLRALSLLQLAAHIDAEREADRGTARARALFHERISGPVDALLFALLAAPLGFAVGRGRSLSACALCGIALLAAYYAARGEGALLSRHGVESAAASSWLVLAAFAGYGVWQLRRIPR